MLVRLRLFCLAAAVSLLAIPAFTQDVTFDSDVISGLPIRAIGPAAMGGRIADIAAVHEGERLTIYVGSASGGVWRSKDGGITFKPVFDTEPTQSIGSVAIDPSDPKTVWVGTGESWARNSVSVGTGVYRSRDGGDNWDFMGLPDSEHVSRILINPKDGKTVYACALGHLWNSNTERGVYKTNDGGKTWSNVLKGRNDSTGCAEMAMDPQDPGVIYAAMWDVRREPWNFRSGGPGGGFFKSTDAGATWHELRKGLPEGDLGRIGMAVAPSNPKRVYAVVEARNHTALFRSEDAGDSWAEINNSFNISGRPFYFARIVVDPKNADRVYKPGFFFTVSEDGGKSFSSAISTEGPETGVHGDFHALRIDPVNPSQMLCGNDGGIYKSLDQATHWRFLNNVPVAQFYHVSADNADPYNVYGGLQDNGSWMGPSRGLGGIPNRAWRVIGMGDGFWAFPDPADSDYAYVEYQGGKISRFRKSTGESRDIKPLPRANEPDFRFNWNAPIAVSPNQKGTIYLGGQFLFRSRDHGESWERISPDLTANNPDRQHQELSGGLTIDNSDAEKYETIYTIAESPKNGLVIWAGTDDGNVQVTRDGGKHWTNVVSNVSGVPKDTWVSTIEASHFDPAVAYVTFDGHAMGDMKTYVYRTKDYGKTWTSLSTAELRGYAHVVREDLVNSNLLFAGTEFGLFISIDGGSHWAQFKGDLPNVAVRDIFIQPRESDLVLATHGRGIYILDDLTPLRALTPEVLAKDLVMLPGRPSVLELPADEQRFDGDAEFMGRTLAPSASIFYFQKKRHIFGDLRADIYDDKGALLTSLQGEKRRGLNRLEWPERAKPPKVPPAAGLVENEFLFFGPQVQEGTYTVKLTKGKETYTSTVKLVPDPRSKSTAGDRAEQHRLVTKLYDDLAQLTYVVDATNDLRDQVKTRAGGASDAQLKEQLNKLLAELDDFRETLVSVKEGGMITGEEKLREHLGDLYGAVNGYSGRPTQSELERAVILEKQLGDAGAKLKSINATSLPALNTALQGKNQQPVKAMSREDWDKKQK